jgi:uncharacterized membrane protein
MSLTGDSFDSVLAGNVSTPVALNALADSLSQTGQVDAAAVVGRLAAASATAAPVQLSNLFDLGPYGGQDHGSTVGGAAVSLNAMSMVSALLTAANGQRQLALDLGVAVPGVTNVKAWLAIGQRPSHSPWITVTQSHDVIVSTAQARIYLQASVAPGLLGAGVGLVNLPVYLQMASAQAKLSALSCPADPTQQSVTLQALPSLGTLAIAQPNLATLNDFTTPETLAPAQLLNLGLLSATVKAEVDLGGGADGWQAVSFSEADIQAGTMKSVYADDIAQASLASLIGNTSIGVTTPLGGLGVSGGGATGQALQTLLQPVGGALDGVIAQLSGLTGVHLGEADVWVDGLRCRGAALVA